MIRSTLVYATLASTLLGAAGCMPFEPPGPDTSSATPLLAVSAAEARIVTGQTGQGAQYLFHVPADWNGSLVLYIHGIRDVSQPVTLDNNNQDDVLGLRAALTAQGYAVAYSSFSENGWAIRDGALRTHQLLGLFRSEFAAPARTYLIGHSLGALIATKLAETYPAHYAGVLPVCGILGGGQMTINYIGNIRLLFDFFYPGVLPGSVIDPAGASLEQVIGTAQAALVGNLAGAFGIAAVMEAIGMPLPLVGATPAEQVPTLVVTILNGLGFHARGFDDLTARTHGHPAFDNHGTDYVIPAVQQGVPRYSAQPDALRYLQQWYQPTGRLQAPMLALDPMFDPVAPLFHKDSYEAAVERQGRGELLRRRAIPTFGHCEVPTMATVAAFSQLVSWVENGTLP
jgi:pimeloyl-ACP methyl ester carboxylesterase